MMDLFGTSLETGAHTFEMPDADVQLFEQAFGRDDADRLFESLLHTVAWQQDQIAMYGKSLDLPRLTAWYGDPGKTYTYSGINMHPHGWTPELLEVKQRAEESAKTVFSSALLNLYRGGNDSVSWHADDEPELGRNPVIASVSLGASRVFQMRHLTRKDLPKVDIPLGHGDLLVMGGATQHHWEHQVAKTKTMVGPRINLTFRVIQ